MLLTLALPTLLLMALAVLVTRALERVVPESMAGLAMLALGASVCLWLLSAGLFGLLTVATAPRRWKTATW